MKIETTTGHYGITITGDVNAEKRDELAVLGLSQGVLYRDVFAKMRETTGAKRSLDESVPFNEDVALKVVDAVEKAVKDYGIFTVDVVNYEGGEGSTSSRKMATEMAEQVKGNVAMLTVLGCTSESSGETVIEACHKFLGGLRKKKGDK